MAGNKPFAVIAKPVGSRCNMNCSYCYYLQKENDGGVMSAPVLERLIVQTIRSSPGPVVSFTWHGGEPTIAGLDFYKNVVRLQGRHLPKGWEVWNNLQTNGLMLNEKWCAFLKANRFDVGLSVDGCQLVHDKNRHDRAGSGTYERVVRAAELLKKAGILPDLLCTVTSDSAAMPLEVYRGLRDLGTGWAQFIPVVVRRPDGGFTPESVSPKAYGEFLCRVFDEWIRNDLGRMDVQLFAETASVWAGGGTVLCWMAQTCGRVLVVEEDGSVYSCDHFVDAEHRLGSIRTDTLAQLANDVRQIDFGNQKQTRLTAQCRACRWLNVCGGGCLKDRFGVSQDGEEGQYYLCEGLRMFFAHAEAPMKRVMQLSRRGIKPDEIMRRLKEDA